jgi:hypothetical protein
MLGGRKDVWLDEGFCSVKIWLGWPDQKIAREIRRRYLVGHVKGQSDEE